jgi:hypothetical protein
LISNHEHPLGRVSTDAKPSTSSPSGMEIDIGDFTRTQGLLKSLRLLLNNQVALSVEDLGSGVNEAGRKFKMGDLEQANVDVARLYAAFGQRTSQWDSQARTLEQNMKRQAANNPKSVSIDALTRMRAEQTAVRTRIGTAELHFRRLHQGLDQAFTNLKRQPVSGLPPAFLPAYKAAAPDERPAIVREHFETIAEVKVTVRRGQNSGYEIVFAPRPPQGSLLFFTSGAELIRLHELADMVVIQNLETGQRSELRLVEFVKLIQSGAWLLAPS